MAKKQRAKRITKQPSPKNKTPVWVWFALSAVAAIVLVVALFYLGNRGLSANTAIEGVEVFPDPGRGHVEGDVNYPQNVPAGGQHSSVWQNCGIYDQPVAVENAVHSLEHGAVWITYQPDLPEDQVENLRNLVRQEQRNRGEAMVLLSPKPDLDVPIIATAWRVQLKLEDASDERLPDFLATYQRGPFTPEPGAACFDGAGTPIN